MGTGRANRYFPLLGTKWYPEDMVSGVPMTGRGGEYLFVDGDKSGDGAGKSWDDAFNDIQSAVTAADAGDVIFISERTITALATDPINYAETIIIPNDKPHLSLIGVSRGRTQGGLPQIKIGAGSTAMITVRAPGCLIANLGFNGGSSTGGGILLDDDGGTSKVAFGTTIVNCHFKNCVGTTATNAATGGAIMWETTGGAWQVRIAECRFYKNVGDVVLKGTTGSVPQDVVIEDCHFSGPAASIDCPLYLGGGSGINGLHIKNCEFPAMPTLTDGSNLRYADLTGCVGIMSGCHFGSIVSPTGSEKTFAAAGTGAKIPAAMYITDCWGETTTSGETGEIFRT